MDAALGTRDGAVGARAGEELVPMTVGGLVRADLLRDHYLVEGDADPHL